MRTCRERKVIQVGTSRSDCLVIMAPVQRRLISVPPAESPSTGRKGQTQTQTKISCFFARMPLAPSDTNSSSTDPVQTTHFYAKEEKAKETRKDNDENHQLPKVKALDIVWARYSGYPKWPAIVW